MFLKRCTLTLPKIFKAFGRAEDLYDLCDLYLYTMHGNCRTGSKLSDDLQGTRNSEDGFDVVRIYFEMIDIRYTDGCCRCFPTPPEDSALQFEKVSVESNNNAYS